MDEPNYIVLYEGIQFDDNLVKWTMGPVALNSVSICFCGQCSRWSKCLRIFNPGYILSVDFKLGGRFVRGIREGIITGF